MSVTLTAWRNCALQYTMGPRQFTARMRARPAELGPLRQRLRQAGTRDAATGTRSGVTLPLEFCGSPELTARLFRDGIPDCRRCPLADGRAVGCVVSMAEHLPAAVEDAIFAHFLADLRRPGSPSHLLYDALIWHRRAHRRNPWLHGREGLAERHEPAGGRAPDGGTVTSADVLWVLLSDADAPSLLDVLRRFWRDLRDGQPAAAPWATEIAGLMDRLRHMGGMDPARLLVTRETGPGRRRVTTISRASRGSAPSASRP